MGLITRLRNKMGSVLVIVIGIALLAFLVGDFLGQGRLMGQGNDRTVGEIDGQEIDYEMYQAQIEELRNNYIMQSGQAPTESYMNTIRQQAWDYLIVKIAFENQYNKAGIRVSTEEAVDMVQGKNIHPSIRQSFTDPQTGQFNPEMVVRYLQQVSNDPQAAFQWQMFEEQILNARYRQKYDELVSKSLFVNKLEAERAYVAQSKTVDADFLYVPYVSVPDSAVSASEEELKAYLKAHAEEFQVDAERSIRYVSFPVVPSAEDSASFFRELDRLKANFMSAENDSLFVRVNSEAENYFGTYSVSSIPPQLKDSALEVGKMYGPIISGSEYSYYKITAEAADTIESARASHILFRSTGDPQKDDSLQNLADQILNRARQGEDFSALAMQYSEDPSSSRGGDLGWFKRGQMVPPFEAAVFERSSAGVVNRVVETQFGYHIIKVTEAPTEKAYKVAKLTLEIYPSDATRDEAFRKAGRFAAEVNDFSSFSDLANDQGYSIRTAPALNTTTQNIRGLTGSREIVRWAFEREDVGEVSDVFELDNAYVVSVLTEITEEGVAPLEEVRSRVELKVKNDKRATIIKDKMAGLTGTLNDIAAAYGTQANVYTGTGLNLSSVSVSGIGLAPKSIGAAFALNEGETSGPIADEGGVVMVNVTAVNEAVAQQDYQVYRDQKLNQYQSRASFNASEVIREKANIEDQRYKFF